jgi:hypothetical protein
VAQENRATRLALAGLCLVALWAPVSAPLFAAEADTPSSNQADSKQQSADALGQSDESGLVNLGGALYSPFTTVFDGSEAKLNENSARPMRSRQGVDEGAPDLVATTIAAISAAGLFISLVRLLWHSA